MKSASLLVPVSLAVSVCGLVALGVAHLALVDIRHGETDVHQEWTALQVTLGVVLISQVLAVVTLWRAFRGRAGRGQQDPAV
jgi:hypothetical protein